MLVLSAREATNMTGPSADIKIKAQCRVFLVSKVLKTEGQIKVVCIP